MVKQDRIAQWVGANEVRRDQLKYVYNTVKRLADSPLRSMLVDASQNEYIIKHIIPMYVAFHAVKNIKDIDKAKHTDKQNKIEKRLRKGLPAEEEPEPEVEVVEVASKK